MNILIAVPGNLRTVPMSRFVPEALGALGHRVSVVDYSLTLMEKLRARLLGTGDADAVAARLLGAAERARPDLFLTLYGVNVAGRVLDELRARGVPSANWWLNDPFQFERATKILPSYDFAFSNARGSVDAYAGRGIRNVHFLPTACEPGVHRPLPGGERLCDISFAGDWSATREQMVGALVAHGVDVRIFGPWRRKLGADSPLRARLEHGFFTPQRMAEIFAACKATLNIHTWRGRFDYGLNPRVFEAAACGTPQLVDHKRELDELFDEGERAAMLVYRSDDELLQQCRRRDLDELRQKALAAAPSIQERHSYLARMRELLRICGK
ncbi:MAG TPA: glycosyltransferase [Burkholderiales bacterium]|nr:glycosyltransferase [Burkholderiales bacterium]